MFFVEEEGTASSFRGMGEVIEGWGLASSLYTAGGPTTGTRPRRGASACPPRKAGVDRVRVTQFGRAMRQLGVEMIPAYSPEARGRCERMFATHQACPRASGGAAAQGACGAGHRHDGGCESVSGRERYRAAFNEEFAVPAAESGTAFVPFIGPGLADVLCEHHERTVGRDHCVSFEGKRLQIPVQGPTAATSSRRGAGRSLSRRVHGGVPRAAQAGRVRVQRLSWWRTCTPWDSSLSASRGLGYPPGQLAVPRCVCPAALRFRRGAGSSPRLATLPAAAVGAILQLRWTPSGGKS